MVIAAFAVGQVLMSMLFLAFFIWIILLFHVFADIFRRHHLSGVARILWLVLIIILPFLGVFVYLIARGHKMSKHAVESAQAQDAAMTQYIPSAVGPSTTRSADELMKLAHLRERDLIDESEYQKLKAKALA